jgi:hypothetical protein
VHDARLPRGGDLLAGTDVVPAAVAGYALRR